jgi:hypothetical protein
MVVCTIYFCFLWRLHTVDEHTIKTDYWPSFLLFAGARREHRLVLPLLQTNNKDSCAAAVLLTGKLQQQP